MIILGIDIGGSTTKIVACNGNKKLLGTLQVEAGDQLTSLYGAIGHFLHKHHLSLNEISKVVVTGVGATLVEDKIYHIPAVKINEFEAIGNGALYLTNLERALVVSMGTGTAYVWADREKAQHIGGSGVGGGTLLGLSAKLFNETNINTIIALAQKGNLNNVDLTVQDISPKDIPSLPADITASNFGKYKKTASKEDLAAGIVNMVYQTIGMLAGFACSSSEIKDVVLTGTLTTLPQAKPLFDMLGQFQNVQFIIPENAVFATAIGAIFTHMKNND